MRILLLCDRYLPEARSIAQLFADLGESLASRGHEVSVLTRMPTEEHPGGLVPREESIRGVRVRRVSGLFSSRRAIVLRAIDQAFVACRMMLRLLFWPRVDVILVYSPPLPYAAACALLRLVRGIPFVTNLHDLYPRTAIELGVLRSPLLIWAAERIESFSYRHASGFVVPAPASKEYLVQQQGVSPEKVKLVFNWVDLRKTSPGPRDNEIRKIWAPGSRFLLSYAGQIGWAQDLEPIMACAETMQGGDCFFLIVGEGPRLQHWRERAMEIRNVGFAPSMAQGDYIKLLRASDVCLVPLSPALRSPAIPGKLQSIMATARPAIAIVPHESNAAWMVRESGCGLLVTPGEDDALREAIRRLREDPRLAGELGGKGRRYAEANFSLENAVAGVEDILMRASG